MTETVTGQPVNPYPYYREMRATDGGVNQNSRFGMWQAFRYDAVQQVLTDYATFSSGSGYEAEGPLGTSLILLNPPRHRQLRSLVTQAFTPRTIARLEQRIVGIVDTLLDAVAHKGEMDVVDDLAYPLPVTVIAEMLGIPSADRDRFRVWSNSVVNTVQDSPAAFMEMIQYFNTIIEQRREDPREDLISALLVARVEDQQLTHLELLGFCILLLVAGNETTTNLIGNAVLTLNEHPDATQQLIADPSLLPSAIEEVLRYRSPVQAMFRHTTRDVIMGDQEIPADKSITAWIGSANRDERQFPNPDTFDIRRTPNRHIAFGHGIHFCLGAPLARLEAKIALGAMLERLPHMKLVPNTHLERVDSFFLYGLKHLPMTFGAW